MRCNPEGADGVGTIIAGSEAIRCALSEVDEVAGADVTVLLLGETGTGKELFARALHGRSRRRGRAFVPVNCAAIPEHLLESEMFGHERGAFTGAHVRKAGRFELAHRGTLFLDEIGDLPLNAQAKLLRVLQNGEVNRVGSAEPSQVDVRIVAATNQDLSAQVAARAFRDDLFYRLSVFPIRIPPLRERVDDIPPLVDYFIVRSSSRLARRVTGIDAEALGLLMAYEWPGNVRELENVIERAVLLAAGGRIRPDAIRLNRMPSSVPQRAAAAGAIERTQTPLTFAEAERRAILDALRRADGRVSGAGGAATLLRVKPTTLHAKMKRLCLRRADALRA